MSDITTIRVHQSTKKLLRILRKKDETFEQAILRLIEKENKQ